ncbi:hypothetical protein CAT723_02080 [Corynebacterium ammoniagenes]|uniref:Uncharacterized protein n=1 Tax=Corynebacterium ammoniagenes TaxID=1697 RepID=A0AAV5G150_CORAM|nr:hypothetical protein CAT723_02080 [Corynebacterium ammoniagenes]
MAELVSPSGEISDLLEAAMVTWFGFCAPQALRARAVVISNAGTAQRDLFM